MPRIPCMEAAVKVIESEGVDCIFGMPGANINAFYQALAKSTKIRHFIARHEEGASHAAVGWARMTGIPGVCVSTSGPAGTNFITGLYDAFADSIPLIAITGQHVRAMQGKEGFQAMDITEVARPVTKKTFYVRDSTNVPYIFREAFRIAKSGRPGPVLIDLPIDVQQGSCDYDPEIDAPLPIHKPHPDLRKIRRAIEMLLAANKPLILAGGGVITARASEPLIALAEHLQIPITATSMAKGVVPWNHPLYAGEVGIQAAQRHGNAVFLDSDVVLAIGCRFGDRHTGALDVYTRGRTFIHIDIEPTQIGRIIPTELGIVADAKLALEALLEVAQAMMPARRPDERVRRIPELRVELARKLDFDDVPIKPQRVFKEINEFFDEDTIFVTCIGNHQIWAGQFLNVSKPGHFQLAGGAGALGWDLPASLGVKLARPDNLVVNIVGDYGMQFCMQELAMAAQYKIPILIIIVNNGSMSLIRQNQKYAYGYRFAVDLTWGEETGENLVDFVKIAEAYGLYGERVTDPSQIKGAFQRAVAIVEGGKTAIVDVIVDRDTDCAMGTSLDAIREFEPVVELAPTAAR